MLHNVDAHEGFRLDAARVHRVSDSEITFIEVTSDSAIAMQAVTNYVMEVVGRLPQGFNPGETIFADDSYCLAAMNGDELVCFGAFHALSDEDAEIKRLWTEPSWRGKGAAKLLLAALEERIVEQGFVRVVLDTNENLPEAIALYDSLGYERIERYNDNPYATSFHAKTLVVES